MIDLALATAGSDIHFPDGLPGFPGPRRFGVRTWPERERPFALLVDAAEPEVAFAVVPASLVEHEGFDVLEAAAAHPTLRALSDAVIRCIVSPGRTGSAPTVNLLAPIVVDRATGIARQVTLDGPADALRATLRLRP